MKLNGLEKYFETINGEIVDFEQVDEFGKTPLMFTFYYNRTKELNLNIKQFKYLIENSNLKQETSDNWSPLMQSIRFNKEEKLNFNSQQFDFLIKNSDLLKNDFGYTSLNLALEFLNRNQLKLKTWKYLIENSDLSLITDNEQLISLKKIQSELLNDKILFKIDIKEGINKNIKI